jgi:hypothetical protein
VESRILVYLGRVVLSGNIWRRFLVVVIVSEVGFGGFVWWFAVGFRRRGVYPRLWRIG